MGTAERGSFLCHFAINLLTPHFMPRPPLFRSRSPSDTSEVTLLHGPANGEDIQAPRLHR
jgi:hypothetical protein